MQLNDQEALDLAFELFTLLASDNLSAEEISLFNRYFEQTGFVELFDFSIETLDELDLSDDFFSLINEDEQARLLSDDPQRTLPSVQIESLVEVLIGAKTESSDPPLYFAKVILSTDKQQPFSHIQWMSDLSIR